MSEGPNRTLDRLARWSGPGYLERQWVAANGRWGEPSENDLRAFLARLAVEVGETELPAPEPIGGGQEQIGRYAPQYQQGQS